MKLNRNSWIALAIGLIFIISGLLEAFNILNIDPKIKNNANWVLLIIAFGLLYSGRKKNIDNKNNHEANSQENKETTEENKEDNK